uniref:Uncharacterized protein n=1 Tax=Romanomermis culicivorax TaxID=13658 RepID=A0A915L294_ROMCU
MVKNTIWEQISGLSLWALNLEFDYEIQRHPGFDNVIPDMLPKLEQSDAMSKVRAIQIENLSLNNITTAMQNDEVLQSKQADQWLEVHVLPQ